MNQVILFSPVGGTDPISNVNFYDGSMLHICRWYQPTKVLMYMSKEIMDFERQDHRLTYALNKLGELQNRKIEYEMIERPDLIKVQDFDYFYTDFRKIIEKIRASMDESDKLLFNISSGTPAMKSGLVVLQTIEEYPCKLIQVTTPKKGMNDHIHEGYDVVTLWELDPDNTDEGKNRCHEVSCPALSYIQKEDIIKNHILKYNYSAALEVAENMPRKETDRYYPLLEMARARSLLDIKTVNKIQKQYGLDIIPVKSSDLVEDFEYALDLQNKYFRKEYADFLRAISPLLFDLYELILKRSYQFNLNDYIRVNSDKSRSWDLRKLNGTEAWDILIDSFNNFSGGKVGNAHLRCLLSGFSSDNPNLQKLLNQLKDVENTRNMAAHQVVGITDESIKKEIGYNSEEIMKMIQNLFSYVGITKKEYWNSHNQMNDIIINSI